MTMDYGDFPITKCPTRAAQGLSGKTAPSITRIMKEVSSGETRLRRAQRHAENLKVRSVTTLEGIIQDRLTGQSGMRGIESREGYFMNQELRTYRDILGKNVCFVQTESMEDQLHQVRGTEIWDILQKRGAKLSVAGYEDYEYRHLKLKDFSIIGARGEESDNIILTWAVV